MKIYGEKVMGRESGVREERAEGGGQDGDVGKRSERIGAVGGSAALHVAETEEVDW